ncbi:MAG: Holliday junction resolvase RuvX [Chloroflexi bacterium]|nr:Holliday junction resolvase RuvX [Chloroflexota bacterium]
MRILAIDVGERRIGVAAADDRMRVAVPIGAIESSDPITEIMGLVEQEGAHRLVVGLPLSLSGGLGPQAKRVQSFVEALGHVLPIPVETWDERLTTVEAERRLGRALPAGRQGRRRKGQRDALAAAIILQAYLDSLPKPSDR